MPRATQTEEFWRDDFGLTPADESDLQEFFIQQGTALTLDEMGRQLMAWRVGGKDKGQTASNGQYNPAGSYEVGQRVTFPSLEEEVGEVVEIRQGNNDRYGPFRVMRVQFNGRDKSREFAFELHDFVVRLPGESNEPLLGPEELYAQFGPYVRESTEWALKRSANFVQLGEKWLPTLLLIPFHEGHRNIADAMIDVIGEPMTTDELLTELPLDSSASDEVRRFSLNYALSQDKQFVNKGSDEQPRWYLRRLG